MVGLIIPHARALDAYQELLVRGYNFLAVLPKVGVLMAFAGTFFGIGVWRFRFESVLENRLGFFNQNVGEDRARSNCKPHSSSLVLQ
jgi:hypothetical protein